MRKLVLGIEDEQRIIEPLRLTFEGSPDIHFLSAQIGAEGLELCRTVLPHLVLLDVRLPDMDGFSICKDLKRDARTANVQVIMLTGMGRAEDVENARGAGADGFLFKPFSPVGLREAVSKQLGNGTPAGNHGPAPVGLAVVAEAHRIANAPR